MSCCSGRKSQAAAIATPAQVALPAPTLKAPAAKVTAPRVPVALPTLRGISEHPKSAIGAPPADFHSRDEVAQRAAQIQPTPNSHVATQLLNLAQRRFARV